jgi:hypothetical protein
MRSGNPKGDQVPLPYQPDTSRPSPRTNRTRLVPHPVLIGRAASLTQINWPPNPKHYWRWRSRVRPPARPGRRARVPPPRAGRAAPLCSLFARGRVCARLCHVSVQACLKLFPARQVSNEELLSRGDFAGTPPPPPFRSPYTSPYRTNDAPPSLCQVASARCSTSRAARAGTEAGLWVPAGAP